MTGSVTLPDGRVLAYEEYGIATGFPVLSFHGGLSSRLDAAPAHEAAVAKGIRLVSPDRPGMGLSTYQQDGASLTGPPTSPHLTEALGIEQFAVMGWSAGGPYAAVCAAKMDGRVTAAALLSSAVPLDLYGTTRGLSVEDRALLILTRRTPWLASTLMKVSIVNASNARLFRAVMRTFPAADRTVLTEWGPPDHALAFVREAMRQGTEGCVQDYRIFGDPVGLLSRGDPRSGRHLGGRRRPDGTAGLPGVPQAPHPAGLGHCRPRRGPSLAVAPPGPGDLLRAAGRRPQRRVHGPPERGVDEGRRALPAYRPPQLVTLTGATIGRPTSSWIW